MPCDHAGGHRRIREIALDELHAVAQVVLVAGDEIVDDAHAVAARDELFGNVRADEAGAAGNEIVSQSESADPRSEIVKCRSEPVSRILYPPPPLRATPDAAIIPLVPTLLAGSSNLPGSADGPSDQLPYLVLLRAGFGLPRLLPAARCALTAPFHPYPSTRSDPCGSDLAQGGIFSVPLSVGSPRPGVTRRTALWSSDFPLPPALRLLAETVTDGSDRPAHCGESLMSPLSVLFLRNLVLLELLIQITPRRIDHLGRLRDVPAILPQLAPPDRRAPSRT